MNVSNHKMNIEGDRFHTWYSKIWSSAGSNNMILINNMF